MKKETKGREPSKPIKIPTVNKDEFITLLHQGHRFIKLRDSAKVRLKKQAVAGVTIPEGFETYIPLWSYQGETNRVIKVKGWKVNEILRTLYLQGLRDGVKTKK